MPKTAKVIAPGTSLEAWSLDTEELDDDLAPLLLNAQGRLRVVHAAELERSTPQPGCASG